MPNWGWEEVWAAMVPSVITLIRFASFVLINPLLRVRRALSTWAEVGSTELQSLASAHLPTGEVSMGFCSLATLPPFWGQRVICLQSFWLSMDLTIWEASLYHCTISFLSTWPPIWPNGVWGQESSSWNWAFQILLWHLRVVSVFNHKYLLKV